MLRPRLGLNHIFIRALQNNMLKPRLIAKDLLKKRTADKERKTLDLNNADIQIIGSNHLGFKPSLLVTSGGASHLFNSCEGLQRFCYANKVKLASVENVLITDHTWENLSGIYGLVLTLQDVGVPSVDIYTPSEIPDYFESTKKFMSFYSGLKCNSKDCHATKEIKDDGISICPVVVDLSGSATGTSLGRSLKSVVYFCDLPDINGPLDPGRCRELRVPIGPKLAQLKSGISVRLDDGTVIEPSQVCGPPKAGMKFVIMECSGVDYVKKFASSLKSAISDDPGTTHKDIDLVVHLGSELVVNDPKYEELLNLFKPSCKHFFVSSISHGILNFIDTYRLNHLLRLFDSEIFGELHLPDEVKAKFNAEQKDPTNLGSYQLDGDADDLGAQELESVRPYEELDSRTVANNLDRLIMRPRRELVSTEQPLALDLFERELEVNPNYKDEIAKLKLNQKSFTKPEPYEPELVFLGTGSAVPSKYRNTSGILLNFSHPKRASVILDCGEDTYGQLLRHYGPERTEDVLRNLKFVYISHQHADHHIGLIRLLKSRKLVTNRKLLLLLPPHIEELLNFHDENFEDLSGGYEIVSTKDLKTQNSPDITHEKSSSYLADLVCQKLDGLIKSIKVVPVHHCTYSCAVTVAFNIGHEKMDTFTISYSGDARPSEEFISAGKNSDLLIHEATFDFRHEEDAIIKKHCTSDEAIKVGQRMGAKFTILTHFSQRLPKIPYLNDMFDEQVGFAFDHMQLRCPSHFPRLPCLKSMLSLAFKKSLDDMDLKHMKEQQKVEIVRRLLSTQRKNITDEAVA